VETVVTRRGEQVRQQPPAHAATPGRPVHVDRVLDRRRVGRTVAEGAQARKAEDPRAVARFVIDGDQGRVRAAMTLDPRPLLVQGPRHELEGHRWFGHLGVVDRRDLRRVASLDESRPHRASVVTESPRPRCAAQD